MAKDKKAAKELTMEEKLAQALVPVEEQPYKIPENWCWVKFEALSEDMADGPFGSNLKTEHYTTNREVRIIQLSNVSENGWRDENKKYTTFEHAQTISRSIVKPGNIIITKMMPAGQAMICPNDEKEYILSSDNVKMVPHKTLNTKYLVYGINSYVFNNQVRENTQGITRARTSIKKLKSYSFPLAPLGEQQRIVDRIESIYAKLDEAREKAQAVVDDFELRKSAILHKAFTGELTKQWRKKRGISIESWRTVPLIEISTLQTGIMKGKHFNDKTICLPYLRVANVQDGYFNLNEIKKIEVSEKMVDRYLLQKGDVLFTEGGDFDKLGRGSVWNAEIEVCLHQNHVFVVRPDKNILDPYFLSLQAGSRYGKKYFLSCAKQTTNLASINSTQLKNYPVRLPVIEEQKEILNMVSDVLEKERQAKEAAELVISQIDVMKKAVLDRAFRGELGTNDPKEKAVELLKIVL